MDWMRTLHVVSVRYVIYAGFTTSRTQTFSTDKTLSWSVDWSVAYTSVL